jgi:hypothetical protein
MRGNVRDGLSKLHWPDGSELAVNYVNNEPVGNVKFFCENQGTY